MAKKTKKVAEKESISAIELAAELSVVRTRMAEDKLLNDALTKEFKKVLTEAGETEAGNYRLERTTAFKVSIEELALPFALQRNLVKVDTGKVHDVFRLDAALRFKDPSEFGFEVVDTVKVSPIRGRKDNE